MSDRGLVMKALIRHAVDAEMARQDAKWGAERHHLDGTGPETMPLYSQARFLDDVLQAEQLAAEFTRRTNAHGTEGTVTWRDILLEEVFEALAEDDEAALETELVQVAAVVQQWLLDINLRKPS